MPLHSANELEASQERAKLGKIRALDDVAQLSSPKFSYLPKLCFIYGPCKLADHHITVHRRIHSACAVNAHVRAHGERHKLTCDPGVSSSKPLTHESLHSRGHVSQQRPQEHPRMKRLATQCIGSTRNMFRHSKTASLESSLPLNPARALEVGGVELAKLSKLPTRHLTKNPKHLHYGAFFKRT